MSRIVKSIQCFLNTNKESCQHAENCNQLELARLRTELATARANEYSTFNEFKQFLMTIHGIINNTSISSTAKIDKLQMMLDVVGEGVWHE
jgi:hypothetical protein